MKRLLLILTFTVCICLPAAKAQLKDSVRTTVRDSATIAKDSIAQARQNKKKIYSIARRSTIMSAILPGLGQAYNKKYWKVPIIYAGLIGFGYLFATNNSKYTQYRYGVLHYYGNDSLAVAKTGYTGSQLATLKNDYKKSRDLGLIGMGIIYVLNIIDANVDGHLRTFDVSDDLSLQIDPWQNYYRGRSTMGISVKLNFK